MKDKIEIRLVLSRRQLIAGVAGLAIAAACRLARSSTVTVTTSFPSSLAVLEGVVTTGGTNAAPIHTLLVRDIAKANVGIGTDHPSSRLDVRGDVAAQSILFRNTGAKTGAQCQTAGALAYDFTSGHPVYCSKIWNPL